MGAPMSNRIKVGYDGASVEEFMLRSKHFSEVTIRRVPRYDDNKPETWQVIITDSTFKKNSNSDNRTVATIEGDVQAAQEFARTVLDKLDELHAAVMVVHDAVNATRNVVRNHEVDRNLKATEGRR
jgi:hypothetical protein